MVNPHDIAVAVKGDLPAINTIYNQAVRRGFCTAETQPTDLKKRRAWFTEHAEAGLPIFVWRESGRLLGWCSLSAYRKGRQALAGCAEISYYVDEAAQGRGIGRALAEHALDWAVQNNLRVLVALLIDGNQPSLRLLERLGFCEWGRIRQAFEYDGELRDHLVYGLLLRQSSKT